MSDTGEKNVSRILLIEDNETMREGMSLILKKMGHQVVEASNGVTGLEKIAEQSFDLVITDYKMDGIDGLEVLKRIKQQNKNPNIEVILITAYGSIELAVEAIQQGAFDFITKPFSHQEFQVKVKKALDHLQEQAEMQRLSEENRYLRDELDVQFNFGEIVGNSAPMQTIYRMIEKVAPTDSSILIYGESGTGKELVARAIHKASQRRTKPFIRVNCGALAEGILESELFGHERGAFTGAMRRKKGRFELAHKGTIFLDEIGDISPAMQLKLLRVVQEKELERVGSEETLIIDVRIIAATNKNLKEEVAKGKFREDLYYRLHILPINMPPLRERKEDIILLTDYFLKKIGQEIKKTNLLIDDNAKKTLLDYNWPGNVRELENVLERAAVLCDGNKISSTDLPILIEEKNQNNNIYLSDSVMDLNLALESVEKRLIENALEKAKGIKTEAARLLNVKTSALYYKMEKYGLI
jgi:two-component system response regulator HydG